MSYLRIHIILAIVALLAVGACSTASPKMKVLGVKAPQIQQFEDPAIKVFVEVHNPTSRNLNLQRMQYRLVADTWFDSTGVVEVRRTIAGGASAVVEIRVPIAENSRKERMQGVPYTLDARLFAVANKTERSWTLSAQGALAASRGARRPLQVADRY